MYRDPGCPTGKIREWLTPPNLEDEFPRATALAATLFEVVEKRELLPLRLPLGRDSWEAIIDLEVRTIGGLNGW
jgi:hypothetical protein